MPGHIHPVGELQMVPVGVGMTDLNTSGYCFARSKAGEPMIMSMATGRVWTIGWHELILIAVAAGINEPDPAIADAAASAIARAMGKAAP